MKQSSRRRFLQAAAPRAGAGGHGMAWKSTSAFYDEVARIPMIVSWPGRIPPGHSEAAATLVDLAPTILELTGQPVPRPMQGRSLAPVLLGKAAATRCVLRLHDSRRRLEVPRVSRWRRVSRSPAPRTDCVPERNGVSGPSVARSSCS
jgi:hypothetical protein